MYVKKNLVANSCISMDPKRAQLFLRVNEDSCNFYVTPAFHLAWILSVHEGLDNLLKINLLVSLHSPNNILLCLSLTGC